MRIRQMISTGCLIGSMAVLPGFASAAEECVAGEPTAASYTWNFQKEATGLIQDLQDQAMKVRDHAARLQSFGYSDELSWQAHADQLSRLKREVNDMGQKLCRLTVIRRELAPWQKQAVNRIAPELQLIADNAQDAITFVNNNQEALWQPTYKRYVDNLYAESNQISNTADNYLAYANAHMKYRELGKELGTKTAS